MADVDETAHVKATQVDDFLVSLARNPQNLARFVNKLPEHLRTFLKSPYFQESCEAKFDDLLRENGGGNPIAPGVFGLSLVAMGPVLRNLAEGHPNEASHGIIGSRSLTRDLSDRFLEVFDVDGNGVIDRREFLDINRFFFMLASLEDIPSDEEGDEKQVYFVSIC